MTHGALTLKTAVHGYGVHELLLRRQVLAAQGRDGPLLAVLPDAPLRGVGPRAGAAGRRLGARQQQERGHLENFSGIVNSACIFIVQGGRDGQTPE